MKSTREHHSPELWVLTTYFNFSGFENRRTNYRLFRQNLAAPLLTVELSANNDFVLSRDDADILVLCPVGGVMWQKERLLNHGLKFLPASCRYVAWIDCDVLFGDENWTQQAIAALSHSPLVQLFSTLVHAPADKPVCAFQTSPDWMTQPSVGADVNGGKTYEECIQSVMLRSAGTPSPGMAWAARRELLEKHGWFDVSIVGGGDTALVSAAYGKPEVAMKLHLMNPHQRMAYQAWAGPFHRSVQGNVGNLPGTILHLWHGDVKDRKPGERHVGLGSFAFDPTRDIEIGAGGAWRWASDKPALHSYIRNYFETRYEDGRPAVRT